MQLQQQEKRTKADYSKLVNAELALIKQKAKSDWLQLSDTNSSFFHSRIKERRTSCKITSIFSDEGNLITDEIGVQEELLKFYNEILGTSESVRPIDENITSAGPIISPDQVATLCAPVTNKKIQEAIFSIPSSKSPGPDEFTSGFYKATWHIVGREVCFAVKDFFIHTELLKEINTIMLTLVPKVSCPRVVGDYKPIVCCNIIYKAISKIITSRLQSVMGNLVDIAQGTFIQDRVIVDNVLVCQGLIRDYHKPTGSPRCLIKLDLKKAYDMLDWLFIEAVLKGLQFAQQFIEWIMICIRTPKFSLLMNGSPDGFFANKRGIRKGDPMSPYNFVLSIEYLSRSLRKLEDCAEFSYHLAFADDLMFFFKADIKSPLLMKKYLEDFSVVSGLKVNYQKSHVFFGAFLDGLKQTLLEQLGFVEGKLPMKYLGVPLIPSKLSISACAPIVEKVQNKLSKWSSKTLTYSRRLQLISSVIFHYQVYWSQIFLFPKVVMKQVEALCRTFLWSGQVERRAMALVAWSDVCNPRQEGGLAIKQLTAE